MHPAILLLTDSRLPAGGHAHSGGVEQAVALGLVHDLPSLSSFLRGRLHTAGALAATLATAACTFAASPVRGDFRPDDVPGSPDRSPPAGRSPHLDDHLLRSEGSPVHTSAGPHPSPVRGEVPSGGSPRSGDGTVRKGPSRGSPCSASGTVRGDGVSPVGGVPFSWELLDAEADARTASPAQREAARLQGRLLLRVARRLWPSPVLDELAREVPSPHHPIALGAAAYAAGAAPGDAALAAAYHAITGPATAAVRLLGLDPVAVHGILADLTPELTAIVEPVRTKFPKPNETARHEPDTTGTLKQAEAGLPEPRGIGTPQLSKAGLHEPGGFGAAEVDGVGVPEVKGFASMCARSVSASQPARGGCGCSELDGYSADPGVEEGGWAALGAPSAPGLDLLAERHAHATVRLFVS